MCANRHRFILSSSAGRPAQRPANKMAAAPGRSPTHLISISADSPNLCAALALVTQHKAWSRVLLNFQWFQASSRNVTLSEKTLEKLYLEAKNEIEVSKPTFEFASGLRDSVVVVESLVGQE
eukprot:GHVN01097175.1.p1 GENE.GHVN01097175.1~~GHVN01097175.1.p1  ORF type:complete len:122 (-),score=10.17 GHVN01097175.1:27-392(-)